MKRKVVACFLAATVAMSMTGMTVFAEQIGSFGGGGDEDYVYNAALYVENGTMVLDKSNLDRIEEKEGAGVSIDTNGVFDSIITDSESGHEGIVIVNSDYLIDNVDIVMETNADGSDTCDFSGVGSAIAAYTSDVTITNSNITTAGVATMPIFADSASGASNGSNIVVEKSTLTSKGGTLNAAYLNTPDQALMVAPPWILGIMGNSRTTNAMGQNTSMDFLDSETAAGAWAVLSTDAGSNMTLNIYNTSLTLLNADETAAAPIQATGGQITTKDNPYSVNYGSGYGTYLIGSSKQIFAGATVNVGTYANIFTNGSATYTSIQEGTTYTLEHADGTTQEYTATATKNAVINSDTFGFMFHQGTNTLDIQAGTKINTGYTTFLMKSGSSNMTANVTVDGTTITPDNGVLVQVMDNDDATTGGMMDSSDPDNTNGGSMNFKNSHNENAGFNTAATESDSSVQKFTFTNGTYTGNLYNASGSDASTVGSLKGTTLDVTIGSGATVNGAIASTAAIHVTKDGSDYVKNTLHGAAVEDVTDATLLGFQNTSFTISDYFDIGQVANALYSNGGNKINVSVVGEGTWNVNGNSIIDTLEIADNGKVVVSEGSWVIANGKYYEGGKTYNVSAFALAGTEIPADLQAKYFAEETAAETTEAAAQTITGVKAKYTVKYKKVKKKAQKVDLSKASAETKLSFKVTKKASAKIAVSKKGVVTLKKGAKKGKYVVTIKAAATDEFKAASKKVTITVK